MSAAHGGEQGVDALLPAEGEADVVAVAGHFRLAGVDANEVPALLFGKMADGRDIGAGADFDADEAVDRSQPLAHLLVLQFGAPLDPAPVAEHQDIGPRQPATGRAMRWLIAQAAVAGVDFRLEIGGGPDSVAAPGRTLQVMDGAMHFADALGGETGLLELAVDVAGEYLGAVFFAGGELKQQAETGVRCSAPIEVEAVTVEAPGEPRVVLEGGGVGDRLEVDAGLAEGRIDAPETARPAKVRQAGIDAHAGAGGDQQRVGLGDPARGAPDIGVVVHRLIDDNHFRRLADKFQPLAQGLGDEQPVVAVDPQNKADSEFPGHVLPSFRPGDEDRLGGGIGEGAGFRAGRNEDGDGLRVLGRKSAARVEQVGVALAIDFEETLIVAGGAGGFAVVGFHRGPGPL